MHLFSACFNDWLGIDVGQRSTTTISRAGHLVQLLLHVVLLLVQAQHHEPHARQDTLTLPALRKS